jgi:hypothetical protein
MWRSLGLWRVGHVEGRVIMGMEYEYMRGGEIE